MERILYLDMDEVITDFIGGCCKLFGVDQVELHKLRIRRQQWEISDIVGELLGDDSLTPDKFYQTIKGEGSRFWKNLQPTPYCHSVLRLMKEVNCEWYILSSPMNHWSCNVGKMVWIEENLGTHFRNYIIHPFKHTHAREGTILVDDRLDNLTKFQSRGGLVHLFGTSPLADTISMADPVGSLRSFLEKENVLL